MKYEGEPLIYMSLGAGVQSTAMLVLANQGKIPRPEFAVFADTGDEPQYVYDYLEILKEWSEIPIRVTRHKTGISLSENFKNIALAGKTFVSIPVYTISPNGEKGLTRRQCTHEFKIEPIIQEVRRAMGLKFRQRVKRRAIAQIGISMDEATRMKPSREKWCTHTWPLIDLRMYRNDCYRIVVEAGLPEPQKSACTFCPFHSDREWMNLRDNHPSDFEKAVEVDELIRNMALINPRGLIGQQFVHNSCVPLREVKFRGEGQTEINWFENECEGMCGV